MEKSTGREAVDVSGQKKLTITGVRITKGNAVDCPQIRTDDGEIFSVSYLASAIALGTRVEVSGFMANVTTCRGLVLYVEQVRQAGN
jgi:hypothetical protein